LVNLKTRATAKKRPDRDFFATPIDFIAFLKY